MSVVSEVNLEVFTGKEMLPYVEDLASLEIEVFRSYPYLYDVSLEYEKAYMKTYARSEDSAVVIAFDGDEAVGASTCIPMTQVEDSVQKPFLESTIPVDKVLYLGESVLRKDYREQGIGVAYFEHRENHAQELGMEYTAFCSIIRPENHPLMPDNYRPLDQFWTNRGYEKHPDMKATMVWKDVNQLTPTTKELVFWIKKL